MEETKFAQLKHEQVKEIKQLEEKLDVTLIAYNNLTANAYTQENSNLSSISPSE